MVVSFGIWRVSCLVSIMQCKNSTIGLVNSKSSGGCDLCKLIKMEELWTFSYCGTITDFKLIMPRFQGVKEVPDDI